VNCFGRNDGFLGESKKEQTTARANTGVLRSAQNDDVKHIEPTAIAEAIMALISEIVH